MNVSSLIGLTAALAVFTISVFTSTPAREIFLDPHGILIVFGGTAAASLICFPLKTVMTLANVFVKKVLGRYSHQTSAVIAEIVGLSEGIQSDATFIDSNVDAVKSYFLKEALKLHLQGGLDETELETILRTRAATTSKRHVKEAGIFKTISRFPPAFGLMGTTLGMIALLQKLGSADAYKLLGPSMAIGLVATFYGIALANLVLIPIGENLSKLNEEDEVLREIVIKGVELLAQKKHPLIVEEYLNSYLLPSERKQFSKAA